MKAKIVYRSQKQDIKNIILAIILTVLTVSVVEIFLMPAYYGLYYGSLGDFGFKIAKFVHTVKGFILSYTPIFIKKQDTLIILSIIFFTWYIIITRKRAKQFDKIMRLAKDMTSGKGYTKLDENIRGDIGELSQNINYIVESLQSSLDEQKILEKTKNELITNVSHDLRTPLTSILGYLSIIDEDRYKDEVELRYYVNIAYEKAKGLNILINDLFELTRMRSTKININKQEIDMCELIGQLSAHFYPQLTKNNMEIRIAMPEEKVVAKVDSSKIVRALENLIINAINYGNEGKYIDILLEVVYGSGDEKKHVCISIENFGEISQMDLPYIFDRFYRVEKSRSFETGGSGLGLAITKSIIDLHDGEISVYSDNGKTIFKIRI